jgi:hypothetical protein
MGTKPALEKERVQRDIVYDYDGISDEVHESRHPSKIDITPDPYSDVRDVVSDAWSVNCKESQGLIRRARQ